MKTNILLILLIVLSQIAGLNAYSQATQMPDSGQTQMAPYLGEPGEPTSPEQAQGQQQLSNQISNNPDSNEVRLSFYQRIKLAEMLFDLLWHGFTFEVRNLAHDITHTSSGLGNRTPNLTERQTQPFEMAIYKFIADLVNKNELRPYIHQKLIFVSKIPIIGKKFKLTSANENLITDYAATQLESEVRVRGLTNDSRAANYLEWEDIDLVWKDRVESNTLLPFKPFGETTFTDAQPLINGEASFKKRLELFNSMQSSLDILVWGIYDDYTGQWLYDQLKNIRTQKPNIAIRIIIDEQTAALSGYHTIADRIASELNVPLIKWRNPKLLYEGMHRKMLVVDGKYVIAGGMNFGDEYSHLNPASPPKALWRDTDVYIAGDAATMSQRYFNHLWDEAVKNMSLNLPLSKPVAMPATPAAGATDHRVTLINQNPTEFVDASPIFISTMNDIETAQKRIDIENAYIITIPSFVEAIQRAIQRGVKVRIYTNSVMSVDEPSLGSAMEVTAQKLYFAGAEVYLRTTSTVHSKIMMVDDNIGYVMSYNLHPQSERIQGEMAYRFVDKGVTDGLTAAFENDINDTSSAEHVTDPKILNVDDTVEFWVLTRLMYDQL